MQVVQALDTRTWAHGSATIDKVSAQYDAIMIYLFVSIERLPLILCYFVSFVARQDTKLPDGSVNVAKDVTFGDVLGTAVGGVLNGAGAIIQGVKARGAGKIREGILLYEFCTYYFVIQYQERERERERDIYICIYIYTYIYIPSNVV